MVDLPATAEELQTAFDQIGADSSEDRPYHISAITSPIKEVVERLGGHNNLDELNLLAAYIQDAEDFQIDNFRTILESGMGGVPQNAAGLINLLYDDNLTSFDVIDAHDDEHLGRYWEDERPERLSPEAYGRMVRNEEGGVYTERGYVCVKYNEFTDYYKGIVPEEYRIVDAALRGIRAKSAGREVVSSAEELPQTAQSAETPVAERTDGYTSVLAAIEKGKTAPKPPRKVKPQEKTKAKDGDSL